MSYNDKSNGNRPAFAIYRLTYPSGDATNNLAQALQKALNARRELHGHPPTGLVVNSGLLGKVREALKILGLPGLQVTSSGGCLAWEVWAEMATNGRKPNREGQQPSLVTRAMEAQREMTPTKAREISARQLTLFEEATT
jgi:hypothetical protein